MPMKFQNKTGIFILCSFHIYH